MIAEQVNAGGYAPGFKLFINGSELDPEAAYSILNLNIHQELNKTNTFDFEVQDEFRAGMFYWLEKDLFRVANTVSISVGYTDQLVNILNGTIKTINGSFHTGCAPTFKVEGTDKAYDTLTTPSETKVFSQKLASDIATNIAQMSGLEPDVDPTQEVIGAKTKAGGKSYLEFLQQLAKDNNYEFFLSSRHLHFRKPGSRQAVTTLSFGQNLISFEPQLNTTAAVSQVIVRGWDSKAKQQIEGQATTGSEVSQESGKQTSSQMAKSLFGDVVKVITDRPVRSVDQAKSIAQSEMDKAGNSLLKATLETVGMPDLIPGVYINIDGFGTLFSGKYYIIQATHAISTEGYRTSLNVQKNTL
jgi:phage protein D